MADLGLEGIITGAMESAGDPIVDTTGDEGSAPEAEVEAAPEADAAPAADADPAAPPAEKAPVAEDEVPDLTEVELAGKTLPLHRHKAVLTKARKAAEAFEAKLKELEWATSVPDAKDRLAAIQIADTNPKLFAQVLLNDEKFAPIFKELMGAASPAPAAAVPPAANAAVAEKPQPDVLLPDGTLGYSQAVQDQLLAWHTQQLETKFGDMLQEKLGKVDPILKEREAQTAYSKEVEKQKVIVAQARKSWPQFEKHEQEIRALLNKPGNEQMSLDEGYRTVVIPKMQADRDAMRKEILAEQGKKAAAPIVPPAGKPAPVAGKRTTEDIIREKMNELSA
jgi:BMFP domain-containing protein YqiC